MLSLTGGQQPAGLYGTFVAEQNRRLRGVACVELRSYSDICLEFAAGSCKAFVRPTGESLDVFRFVHFRGYFNCHEQAAAIAAFLDHARIPFVCGELRHYMAMTKLTQLARLAPAGLPIPHTLYMDAQHYAGSYGQLSAALGTPFIFKAIGSDCGKNNYLIHSRHDLAAALAPDASLQFIAQTYIANDSDLRVLIVGGRVQLLIRRERTIHPHLNNTSQGGRATLVPVDELEPEYQRLALRAAALMHREVAGVDLMFESGTGRPYVLEVNASPQIASGAFIGAKADVYSNYFRNMVK